MQEIRNNSFRHDRRWRHGPSLFFPVALITVGIIWILVNGGYAPVENAFRLLFFWPVLIIAAGVAIIFRQISWIFGGLVWMAVGAAAVWLVVSPPADLPGLARPELTHRTFSEPLEGTQSAAIDLNLSYNPVIIEGVSEPGELFSADVSYVGGLHYEASGSGGKKKIRLGEEGAAILYKLPSAWYESRSEAWQIGLSSQIPLALRIRSGFSSAEIDLSTLQLASLDVNGGLGNLQIRLPEDSAAYSFNMNMSAGDVEIDAPAGATFDMTLTGGVGGIDINLPEDSGIQITVRNGGPGRLNLPEGYRKVQQGNDDNEGVWQNEMYGKDETPIRLLVDLSIGGVTIR
jgi:hypothetical protein